MTSWSGRHAGYPDAASMYVVATTTDSTEAAWFTGILAAALALATVAVCFLVIRSAGRETTDMPTRLWRLSELAAANDCTVTPLETDPERVGTLFKAGTSARRLETVILRPADGLEVGVYRCNVAGAKGTQSPWTWHFVRFPLSRSAPDLLLDAQGSSKLAVFLDQREPLKLRAANGRKYTLWAWRKASERARATRRRRRHGQRPRSVRHVTPRTSHRLSQRSRRTRS